MNLQEIALLVEAVQAGSLAAAARRLKITPMVASRRLAALEDELGVRLVHRTTRSLSLTPEGEAFLPYAQAMLEDEADGRAAIRPTAAGASGLLRVTASVPFGRKMVTPVIASFLRDNPEVSVELVLTDSIVDIVGQGIDLAIRIAPLRDSSLIARKLADNPRGLYATPGYLAAHGVPETAADLQYHECLCVAGSMHWSLQEKGGADKPIFRQRIGGRFTASTLEALHRGCLEGMGIANLSCWLAREDVEAGLLLPVHLKDAEPDPLDIWAVYPTTRHVPPKVRLFLKALGEYLEGRT